MAITAWIGAQSGLPSLLVDGPATITAGDRILAIVGPGQHLVADAMAAPDVPTVYESPAGRAVLTRPAGDWYGALVAGADGRSAAELIYAANGDPVDWDSTASTVAGVTRWALRDKPATGSGVVVCPVGQERILWATLRERTPIMLILAAPTDGVPPRIVIVTGLGRKRLNDDLIEIAIKWSEHTPAPGAGVGAVPVVTWGEWAAWGEAHPGEAGWRAWSALDVARRIAGMP